MYYCTTQVLDVFFFSVLVITELELSIQSALAKRNKGPMKYTISANYFYTIVFISISPL